MEVEEPLHLFWLLGLYPVRLLFFILQLPLRYFEGLQRLSWRTTYLLLKRRGLRQ